MATGLPFLFVDSASAVTATLPAGYEVGMVRHEGADVYQLLYNAANSAINPTYGAVMTLTSTSGYSVTVSSVSATNVGMGIVKHATVTTGTYGWFLKRGVTNFENDVNTACVAGDGLVMGTGGTFKGASMISGQSSDIGIINICGVAASAVASGGSGLAYFNFL